MPENSGDGKPEPRRNAAGQFVKGSSGNPKGRPKKRPVFSPADTLVLANTVVNVKIDGTMREMTRRELNHLRLFEAANRGDVRAQIYLDRKFEKLDEARAHIWARLQRLEYEHIYGPEARPVEDMPSDVQIWMQTAYDYLRLKPMWDLQLPEDDPVLLQFTEKLKKYFERAVADQVADENSKTALQGRSDDEEE
jgi:hypothetical protein